MRNLLPLFVKALVENRAIAQGDPASWPIANDVHACRVIAGPTKGTDDRGRDGTIVTLLVQRTTREGQPYTRIQKVLENFVFEPDPEAPKDLIFGTEKAPLSLAEAMKAHGERFGSFLAERADDAVVTAAE